MSQVSASLAHLSGYRAKPLILLLCYERPTRAHLYRERESLERVALQEHYTALPRDRGPIQHHGKEPKIIRDYRVTHCAAVHTTRPPAASPVPPRYEAVPVTAVQC